MTAAVRWRGQPYQMQHTGQKVPNLSFQSLILLRNSRYVSIQSCIWLFLDRSDVENAWIRETTAVWTSYVWSTYETNNLIPSSDNPMTKILPIQRHARMYKIYVQSHKQCTTFYWLTFSMQSNDKITKMPSGDYQLSQS